MNASLQELLKMGLEPQPAGAYVHRLGRWLGPFLSQIPVPVSPHHFFTGRILHIGFYVEPMKILATNPLG